MSKFTRIVNRRRQGGEIPTLRVAVRNFCLECVGYSALRTADVAGLGGGLAMTEPERQKLMREIADLIGRIDACQERTARFLRRPRKEKGDERCKRK